jgi:7-cyano-7-deazaguanine synthase
VSRAVVLLSGGIDSSTLLYHAKTLFPEVLTVSFNYGQKHVKELVAAARVAKTAGVFNTVLDIRSMGLSTALGRSALLDPARRVPEGNYTDASMAATVVPNRNMILLAYAGAFALSEEAGFLCYAPHAGDHTIYEDCRPSFVHGLGMAFEQIKLALFTPFIGMTKFQIVELGGRLGVPYGLTWSCYKGEDLHCGLCGTCVERKEAFELAGLEDPTDYVTPRRRWDDDLPSGEKDPLQCCP